jgi:hypothetical protein
MAFIHHKCSINNEEAEKAVGVKLEMYLEVTKALQ